MVNFRIQAEAVSRPTPFPECRRVSFLFSALPSILDGFVLVLVDFAH